MQIETQTLPAALGLAPQPTLPFQAALDYESLVLRRWTELGLAPDQKDRAYGTDPRQTYDVFLPAAPDGAPVLIFWHGGGWTNGYKEYCHFMAPHVTALGAILVTPNYRLAPDHRLPAAVEDSRLLLDHLAADPTFPGNMDGVILSGHSAGGQLAALMALHRGGSDADWRPGACLPISGIMELGNDAPAGSFDARIYEMVLGERDDDVVMSPICWTVGNEVPFVLRHGENDSPRVLRSNGRLAALLALQPGASERQVEPDQTHFSTHTRLDDPSSPWYADLARFLEHTA